MFSTFNFNKFSSSMFDADLREGDFLAYKGLGFVEKRAIKSKSNIQKLQRLIYYFSQVITLAITEHKVF